MRNFAITLASILAIIYLGQASSGAEKLTMDDYASLYNSWDWKAKISGNKADVETHFRITVKNRRGDDNGHLYFSESRYIKLKDVSITVSDTTGKVLNKYGRKDLQKACGYGSGYELYSDACTYYLNATVATFPYVIDVSAAYEYSSLFFLRGFTIVDDIPVAEASAELTFPTGKVIHSREYGLDIPKTDSVFGDKTVWCWKAHNLLPVKADSLLKHDADRAGRVVLATDEIELGGYKLNGLTWQNIGRWYNELAGGQYDPSGWPQDNQWRNDSLPEIMRDTYDKLRKSTRYVAVSIGIGGWQPRSAKITRETSFGDCKDLSTLLISELRRQRVHAYPVLVLTKDEGTMDTTFPSFEFNHVITAVPAGADTFWLDPTCDGCPYGDLPSGDEDINVLLVDENGGHVVRTPGSKCDDNRVLRIAHVKVWPDFGLTIEGSLTYTGNYAHGRWTELSSMKSEELAQFIDRRLGDLRTPLAVKEVTVENGTNNDSCVTVRFRATSKKPLRLLQSTLYLVSTPFYKGSRYNASDLEDLKHPLYLGAPNETVDSIVFVWDSTMNVDSVLVPQQIEISDSSGTAACRCIVDKDSVTVVLTETQAVYEVPPSYFDSFLIHEAAIAQMNKQYAKLFIGTH